MPFCPARRIRSRRRWGVLLLRDLRRRRPRWHLLRPLPVVLYATDYSLRDPTWGTEHPEAAQWMQAHRMSYPQRAVGARIIGVNTSGWFTDHISEMTASRRQPVVLRRRARPQSMTSCSLVRFVSSIPTTIVSAIEGMLDSVTFSEVTLEVVEDTYGFVTAVDPSPTQTSPLGRADSPLSSTSPSKVVPVADDQIFVISPHQRAMARPSWVHRNS